MAEMPDSVGPRDVAIRGGSFAAGRLEDFLAAWQLPRRGLLHAIWEWVHRIDFVDGGVPPDLGLLERGVVFGPEGSLSLRRDGEEFRWHFVGEPAAAMPAEFPGVNYWERHGQAQFRRREVRFLLWGKASQGSGEWLEDRVRRARLRYPAAGERVQIVAWQLTDAGVEAFVWWRGVEEHRA